MQYMRYPYIIIFFCLPFFILGQGGFKSKPMTPPGINSYSKFIFETSPGNYLAGGLISDTLNNSGVNSIVISGLNSIGQVLWTKKYRNGKLQYVYNPFINRSFYKQNNFLYHACSVLDSNGKYNGALLKFNLSGDTLWQKIYRDTAFGIIPQMVTGSVDGGFLITGYFIVGNPCLLIKTDANGNELWRKKITKVTPSVLDGKAIIQDSASKKIVIVGNQYTGMASSPVLHDNVLILDSLGNKLFHNYYTNVGGALRDLIQTKDKKFVAVGYQYYPSTLGGNNLVKSFAVKFDIDSPAVPIWKIDGYDKLGLDNAFSCLKELGNGDILISGAIDTVYGTLNTPNNIQENILNRFTTVTPNGTVKRSYYYDYKTNLPTESNSQGISSFELCNDGGWVASIGLYNTEPNPFFFVKYDSTGCDSSAAYCATLNLVGINEMKKGDMNLKFFPNPVKDFLSFETPYKEEMELCFTDVSGREVKRLRMAQNTKIDLRDLENGMYLITISCRKEIINKTKIIKE